MGYKVRIHHWRIHRTTGEYEPARNFRNPSHRVPHWLWPKGGKTVVQITTGSGRIIEAEALCSRKDGFNRKLGVQIALNRAIHQLGHETK